ncbi:MAG: transglutaminaseTgpA domain-containing protein [Planctomycetota bacterium]
MDLAAAFYLSVYGLAALAGGILAWAEQAPSVTALTPPIAVAALLLNERFRVLRLDGFWIAGVGLAAFVYPTFEFFNGEEEVRLLAGAHLLAILQWVLLFYNKSAHQYWWICAVSCLQIALAALLTSSPLFGVLILIYMFLALWTLSVFTLLLARLRYGREGEQGDRNTDWVWPRLRADEVLSRRSTRKLAPGSPASEFRSAFQGNAREADLNWRFVFGVCGLSASALFLGLIFFLLTPRLWLGAGNPFQDANLVGSVPVTGFSEKVQLRDFGRILESAAPVLELSVVDNRTNIPVHLHEYLARIGQTEPLLRGAVLGTYQDGEWYPPQTHMPPGKFTSSPSPSMYGKRDGQRYVRQTIRLEPNTSRTVFSLVDPEYGIVEDQAAEIKIFHEMRTLILSTHLSGARGAIRYHLVAPERTGNALPPRYSTNPAPPEIQRYDRPRGRRMAPHYLALPPGLNFTEDLARQILVRARSQSAPDEPTPTLIADTIVSYLRDSGIYQYSLDQTRIDPKLDPVEDFLKHRKTGHCQYFATSLALLLRSLGIQSRVVTGFKGGIETPEAGTVQVQQRHAHAWVEAKIDDAWVTLDATPSVARDESVAAVGDRVRWYHSLFSMAGGLWNDYVVNLSFTKQQRDLYAPMQALGKMLTTQIAGISNVFSVLQHTLYRFWQHPEEWFSVRGGVTAFLLMLTLVGLFYLGRYLWLLIVRISLGQHGKFRGKIYVEFYERFLTLVKPLGFAPQPNQTQLEFAQQVEAAWMTHQLPAELRSLAQEISIAFYRLRFGSEVLSTEQEEAIKARLKQLELQLRK